MSKVTKSGNTHENYLAAVVECLGVQAHPDADKLEIVDVVGSKVVIGKNTFKKGDKLVYFPIESQINAEFLSWANLFEDPAFNADKSIKGFFSVKQRRVKPIKLRGVPSEGFLYSADKLAKFFGVNAKDFKVGQSFDTVDGKVLVEKYAPPLVGAPKVKKPVPAWIKWLPRPIRKVVRNYWQNSQKQNGIQHLILPGEFELHYDTPNLNRHYESISPDDYITISMKMHGTSAVFGKLRRNQVRGIFDKILGRKKGWVYDLIYSSRSIVKNKRDGKWTEDVWGLHAAELKDSIEPGFTLYGEIVGYSSPSKMVQKGYDYGCPPGESEFYVYRITETTECGGKKELMFPEIRYYCVKHGLKHTPVFYTGRAGDLFPGENSENWQKDFYEFLSATYLEKTCSMCKNKVPEEGIVLKINDFGKCPVYKHKSYAFKMKESKDRDSEVCVEAE